MATGARRFGVGQARTTQGVFAFVGLTQVMAVVSDWRYAGGPDGLTVISALGAVMSLVLVLVVAPRSIVRVGEGRISWWFGRRHHDLAFDEVADIRPDPRWWAASQLVTTDGRVLRLPLQPHHGPAVWRLVLGDRTPSPA
jgi:hypothetical protein